MKTLCLHIVAGHKNQATIQSQIVKDLEKTGRCLVSLLAASITPWAFCVYHIKKNPAVCRVFVDVVIRATDKDPEVDHTHAQR